MVRILLVLVEKGAWMYYNEDAVALWELLRGLSD